MDIRNLPNIVKILLIDRTRACNIIWANDIFPMAQIKPELVKNIMPRSLKTLELQKKRTKTKAEVFTPTWIIKKQNDAIDADYKQDDLETYVKRKWLEITCGEGPYMTTRYDMITGEFIPIINRVGFVDRKLERINNEIIDKNIWQYLVKLAYKSSYGFEWNGDSLFIARENLLYTFCDYYYKKWGENPCYNLLEDIANIISYNVFQMDGLTYTIPLSQETVYQLSLDGIEEEYKMQGIRAKIMNWDTNTMEFFDKGLK